MTQETDVARVRRELTAAHQRQLEVQREEHEREQDRQRWAFDDAVDRLNEEVSSWEDHVRRLRYRIYEVLRLQQEVRLLRAVLRLETVFSSSTPVLPGTTEEARDGPAATEEPASRKRHRGADGRDRRVRRRE